MFMPVGASSTAGTKSREINPGFTTRLEVRQVLGEPILAPEGLDVEVYYLRGMQYVVGILPFPGLPLFGPNDTFALATYRNDILLELDVTDDYSLFDAQAIRFLKAGRYLFAPGARALQAMSQDEQLLTVERLHGTTPSVDMCSLFILSGATGTISLDGSSIGFGRKTPGYLQHSTAPGRHTLDTCSPFFDFTPGSAQRHCLYADLTCLGGQPLFIVLDTQQPKPEIRTSAELPTEFNGQPLFLDRLTGRDLERHLKHSSR